MALGPSYVSDILNIWAGGGRFAGVRMFFKFDATKAVEAIGVILRNHPGKQASKMRILKLLYIADREAIKEVSRPILGTRTVAMDHGPLHSAVLSLINGEHIDEPVFARYFALNRYIVQMTSDPGVTKLSRFDVQKLTEVCEKFEMQDDSAIAHAVCHAFDEYKAVCVEGTAKEISLESILDAVNRTADKSAIMADWKSEISADQLFGEPSL